MSRNTHVTGNLHPTGNLHAIVRAPIFWLAVALFAASIAGCIVTIVLALDQPDDALPGIGERLLKVPSAHAEAAVTHVEAAVTLAEAAVTNAEAAASHAEAAVTLAEVAP